jgi:oxygen-independent coproporphyrinogen-3 oxidase
MAGIYFHIPFCKQACHYCNFHFSTSLQLKESVIDGMLKEIAQRAAYLPDKKVSSIYFGGGTPSLLTRAEIVRFFEQLHHFFDIEKDAEITLEANPDDLSKAYLEELSQTPVNRLSIGIQSFKEEDLRFMNRAHNAAEAMVCIDNALAMGFESLTVDLIYGAPTTSDKDWADNLATIFEYPVNHLSCYALTVEEKTALHHFVKTGKVPAIQEEKAARQFEYLIAAATAVGFLHYEISNFAQPGHFARHNSSYWQGEPYLGIGPGAHSYDGHSRQWNVANNARYAKAFQAETATDFFEQETLSIEDRYNEYVMTGLRTIWGVEQTTLAAMGPSFEGHFISNAQQFLEEGIMLKEGSHYRLSAAGRLLADGVAAALFY